MGARTVVVLEAENEQFPKELAQVRMERDTVKKMAAYFAKKSVWSQFEMAPLRRPSVAPYYRPVTAVGLSSGGPRG